MITYVIGAIGLLRIKAVERNLIILEWIWCNGFVGPVDLSCCDQRLLASCMTWNLSSPIFSLVGPLVL